LEDPLEVSTGHQPDISAVLAFRWFGPVYYKSYSSFFPSTSQEKLGGIVGIAEHRGDTPTFLVLDTLSSQVLSRSELRSAVTNVSPNIWDEFLGNPLDEYGDAHGHKPIMASSDIAGIDINPSDLNLPRFSPE
jgi:hypothetical protein